jgi:sulfite reductase (NADPH) flavoprotein alpha-component
VLALGDSTYEHFCQTGKDFDARLEALGATRLVERVDCDVDFDDPAEAWADRAVAALAEAMPAAGETPAQPPGGVPTGLPESLARLLQPEAAAAPAAPRYDRKNPFEARLLESLVLNGRGSDKETRHVELSIEDSGLVFEPGDSLGIVAENDPALVEEVIETAGLDLEAPVNGSGEERRLADALLSDYEITVLTPPFLKGYAELAGSDELRALVEGEDRAPLQRFLAENRIIDVLARYPAQGLDAQAFTGLLRKLQPRLYSIASSQKASPDEVHLTVAPVRYALNGREHKGVASTYLSDRREPDDTVKVYVEPNKTFKPPEDPATPIIMIGAGTGIAPYRAFLQEREETGAGGPAWLIFGDRRFRTDFLYQTEWQGYLKDGLLTRMDVAWSRDGAEKDYVQHRILDRSRDIYAWLEDGAHLYVCGDAERMAPDVHDALHKVVEREAGVDAEEAAGYVRRLQEEKRYLRDVY